MSNGEAAGTVLQIVSGLLEQLAAGDITLRSDRASTNLFNCNRETCSWQERSVLVYTDQIRILIFGGRRARLELFLRFEFNGCDVNDARIVLGSNSFVGFLSGAEFHVEARAGASQVRGPSGCADCCPQSACVNFDIVVSSDAALTFGTGSTPFSIRVCGDGNFILIP